MRIIYLLFTSIDNYSFRVNALKRERSEKKVDEPFTEIERKRSQKKT